MDLTEATDTALVDGMSKGSETAFAILFDRHSGPVYRFAWGLADGREDVNDIVQETFLVTWKRRKDIRVVGDSALPWLLTTCRNTAYNLNRARRRSAADELSDPAPGTAAWYRQSEHERASEELRWVRGEIARLPDSDRRLCELCLIEGQTYAEAAAALGLKPATARKRIERARTKLHAARVMD